MDIPSSSVYPMTTDSLRFSAGFGEAFSSTEDVARGLRCRQHRISHKGAPITVTVETTMVAMTPGDKPGPSEEGAGEAVGVAVRLSV